MMVSGTTVEKMVETEAKTTRVKTTMAGVKMMVSGTTVEKMVETEAKTTRVKTTMAGVKTTESGTTVERVTVRMAAKTPQAGAKMMACPEEPSSVSQSALLLSVSVSSFTSSLEA